MIQEDLIRRKIKMPRRITQREIIIKKVYNILENSQQGIRYANLVRSINEALPQIQINVIHATVYTSFKRKIDNGEINDVLMPERGLYILKKYFSETPIRETIRDTREENFYKPFANYLVENLGECTNAISLGGNIFQDRWGTPDVLGSYKFSNIDPVQPSIEIISAEIKTDSSQLITAFGQACSYKLFSHKVYLVIPKGAEKDISRIESLCSRFDIGLILFNNNDYESPNFEIRTRARKNEPDYFYVNEYLRRLGNIAREII